MKVPVAGVDGMRGGWLIARLEGGAVSLDRASTFAQTVALTRDSAIVAVDMPIGLLDRAERGGRTCDRLARQRLGRRASSVFSPPCRAALRGRCHAQAQMLNRTSGPDAPGLSIQCWNIVPRLREVDEVMSPARQARIVEVHPELAFATLRGQAGQGANRPSLAGKKSAEGRAQRRQLLAEAGIGALGRLLDRGRALGAGADDVLDATVAMWSAGRIACGQAGRLPEPPPVDSHGLRMEIWS